ncbi:MAG TPA: hypothetical protein VJN96_06100 [Vicinamibacterales bacterium]|nr:hypothetical protein [Vicinamibacterales bacterium]
MSILYAATSVVRHISAPSAAGAPRFRSLLWIGSCTLSPIMPRHLPALVGALVFLQIGAMGAPAAQTGQPAPEATPKLRPEQFKVGDPSALSRRLAATLEWETDAYLGEYERHGHRDSHWDDAVESALRLLARDHAHDPLRPADLNDQAWYALQQATTAGCDDSLIEYLNAELSRQDLPKRDAAIHIRNAALRLEKSRYSAYRRGSALIGAASALYQASRGMTKADWDQTWPEIDRLLDRSLMLVAEVARDKKMPDDVLLQYVNTNNSVWVDTMKSDRRVAFDFAYAAIAAERNAKDPILPLLRTRFYALYAWDIRGTDLASKVKDEAWRPFKERLHEAEDAAAEAVALGSTDAVIPRSMSQVVKGLRGNLDELEAWFALGVAVDPGDRSWYEAKLDWLMPKWYGSIDEAVDYVNAARRTGSWNLRVPLLVVDLYDQLRLAIDLPQSTSLFDLPGACDDILPVYDAFLKRYPNAGWDRGRYVLTLADCRQWKEADRQMNLIAPDRLRVGAFGGRDAYDTKRKLIALHLH